VHRETRKTSFSKIREAGEGERYREIVKKDVGICILASTQLNPTQTCTWARDGLIIERRSTLATKGGTNHVHGRGRRMSLAYVL